jgi:DNA-binding PadR family transcriptional regulator
MSRSSLSNPLALAVLATLVEEPMHPYRITQVLRERGKEHSIRLNWGSLYSVIASLEKNGLIVATRSEREGSRPERTVYAITDEGRAKALGWLRRIIEVPVKEYPDFEAGLSLIMLLGPDEAAALLARRLELLDARIAEARAADELPLPEIFLVESRFELAMLEAERAFVADLVARLAAGRVGGQDLWTEMHRRLAQGGTIAQLVAEFDDHLWKEGTGTRPGPDGPTPPTTES